MVALFLVVEEEARVLHFLLRPAEFEEVVWGIEPLLHLHVPFHHNAMEEPIDCRHSLNLTHTSLLFN